MYFAIYSHHLYVSVDSRKQILVDREVNKDIIIAVFFIYWKQHLLWVYNSPHRKQTSHHTDIGLAGLILLHFMTSFLPGFIQLAFFTELLKQASTGSHFDDRVLLLSAKHLLVVLQQDYSVISS